jgi:hypothetical protein
MRLIVLALALSGCVSQPHYDSRVQLRPGDSLNDVSRFDLRKYTCVGRVMIAQSRDGWHYDIRCPR